MATFYYPLIFASLILLVVGTNGFDSCTHNGIKYRNGDEWIFRRSFIMKCHADDFRWEANVIACLSPMGQRIPIGGRIQDRHGKWKCIQEANAVKLVQEL
ncbi:hypothetical protein niasHS_009946 [Heterodera schachtii]|uniref:Abnormal cell migration protein 18-like fibronectin type I domain-containing protein n=2 Tax=Heterodera TaxID=34509 RepID=A0ABD2JD32_HETSC